VNAKNVSFRSRQVKNFASAGIRPKGVYRFGTTGCKVPVVALPAWRSSVKMLLDLSLGLGGMQYYLWLTGIALALILPSPEVCSEPV
jgi:hypothetical protein